MSIINQPKPWLASICLVLAFCGLQPHLQAQTDIKVTPTTVQLDVSAEQQLQVQVLDEQGGSMQSDEILYYSRNGRIVSVDTTGLITAEGPGETTVIVIVPNRDGKYLRQNVSVAVNYPPLDRITFEGVPQELYAQVPTGIDVQILDRMNRQRKDLQATFTSSNTAVASFDAFNTLTGHKAGRTTITAEVDNIKATYEINIRKNPVARIDLSVDRQQALSGDILYFTATTLDASGQQISDAPVTFNYSGQAANQSEFAAGMVKDDGRFVAYKAGTYTVTASCGNAASRVRVMIGDRQQEIARDIELVGRGAVHEKHTSDLWVWEGVDGLDYAVTGTWGADGTAYFWDVTDPANIVRIDSVQVDARTVNDVKISEDGRIGVISREGASNRKNGIIILDVSDPANVEILSEFNDGLTGGVHNVFIYQQHVYALSNAERYDIINIEDPRNPRKVGAYELQEPGHSIHDVWVQDGIAYSSNWHYGVHIVDVGNGVKGGSPSNPQLIGSFTYPSGWNHAAFPFYSESTGKFYVIAGDEAFPNGLYVEDRPTIPAGWLHIFDCTDMENPQEVAKYEVEGAGSHNFWIEDETLYVANYNAGLRVVDISGELLGDLREQGREMGWFMPTDSDGVVPNAAMTWGPQPHKGHIFFSDWNTGLWAVKMEEKKLKN